MATLFFPLIPLTIKNLHRLSKGEGSTGNGASKSSRIGSFQPDPQSPSPSVGGEEEIILSGGGATGGEGRGGAKRSLIGDLNTGLDYTKFKSIYCLLTLFFLVTKTPSKSPTSTSDLEGVTTPTQPKSSILKHSTARYRDHGCLYTIDSQFGDQLFRPLEVVKYMYISNGSECLGPLKVSLVERLFLFCPLFEVSFIRVSTVHESFIPIR